MTFVNYYMVAYGHIMNFNALFMQRNATQHNETKDSLSENAQTPRGSSIGLLCLKEIVCVLFCVRRHDQCGVCGAAAVGGRATPRNAAPGPRATGVKKPPVVLNIFRVFSEKNCLLFAKAGSGQTQG